MVAGTATCSGTIIYGNSYRTRDIGCRNMIILKAQDSFTKPVLIFYTLPCYIICYIFLIVPILSLYCVFSCFIDRFIIYLLSVLLSDILYIFICSIIYFMICFITILIVWLQLSHGNLLLSI